MKPSKGEENRESHDDSGSRAEGKGSIEETLLWYNEQIEKSPRDIGLHFSKAGLLAKGGRYEDCIMTLDEILEINPNNVKVWYDKGECLLKLDRCKEAIECFDKAVHLDPEHIEAWLGRGNAVLKLRTFYYDDDPNILDKERKAELEDALDTFTMVAEMVPDSVDAWHGKL
jgi:tetratricopeptide (TPR) repeat protein